SVSGAIGFSARRSASAPMTPARSARSAAATLVRDAMDRFRVQYTAAMLSGHGGRIADVAAAVVSNHRLSDAYNGFALAAPDVGAQSNPGQFVMVKAGNGVDPLLRRPFSVFEVLRDGKGSVTGVSILSKRIGVSTQMLYDAKIGDTIACLGPLGRPFTIV